MTTPPEARALLTALALSFLSLSACDPGETEGGQEAPTGDEAPVAQPLLDAPDSIPPLPREVLETAEGEATFYADLFQGRPTASGERFDQNAMVAAHLSYPFGTRLRVTEPRSGRKVVVRVVDRGPHAPGRRMPAIIDLSRSAADRLGIIRQGRAVVTVEVLEWG